MKFLLITALFMATKAFAVSGGSVSNGGDMCENRFYSIRNDITSWILQGGSQGLALPQGLFHEQYNQDMLEQMKIGKVTCTEDKIFVGAAEKTCKNFVAPDGSSLVTCNVNRFMNTSDTDQYVLVHHEYAGLAGFETNQQEVSDYAISNQITGYLADQVVKKLVVNPAKPPKGDAFPWPWTDLMVVGKWRIEGLKYRVILQSLVRNENYMTVEVFDLETCKVVGQGTGIKKNGVLVVPVSIFDSILIYSFKNLGNEFVVSISNDLEDEGSVFHLTKINSSNSKCDL